jgi:hypothetical protein
MNHGTVGKRLVRFPLQRARLRVMRREGKQRELLRLDLFLPGNRHDAISFLLHVEGEPIARGNLHHVHARRNLQLDAH